MPDTDGAMKNSSSYGTTCPVKREVVPIYRETPVRNNLCCYLPDRYFLTFLIFIVQIQFTASIILIVLWKQES